MNLALRLLLGDLPSRRAFAVATGSLVAAGAFAGFAFMQSPLSWIAPAVASIFVAGLFLVANTRRTGRIARVARAAARAVLVVVHGFLLYEAACFGLLLGWTWPGWVLALCGVTAVAWIVTARHAWHGPRVPLIFPLGIASVASLWGWVREESLVRCDDYRAAVADASVHVVVPVRPDLASCMPREARPIHHYPRKVVEFPDRVVFTTQAGEWSDPSLDSMPGAVCEAPLSGGPIRCSFEGKAHAVHPAPDLGSVLVAFMRYGEGKGRFGALMALPLGGGLEPVRVVEADQSGELFYDPGLDRIGLFGDRQDSFTVLKASSFEVLSREAGLWNPGETRYDPARHEGVLCGSAPPWSGVLGSLAHAFTMSPRTDRLLGEGLWERFALSWGCDVDLERRRVFASVANFGLVVEMDLDSGQVLRARFLGLGLRSVLLDAARGRLYVADFLRGRIHELDAGSLVSLRAWFAGRYVRDVVFGRDGRSLLVTSNLGVVQILLDGTDG